MKTHKMKENVNYMTHLKTANKTNKTMETHKTQNKNIKNT